MSSADIPAASAAYLDRATAVRVVRERLSQGTPTAVVRFSEGESRVLNAKSGNRASMRVAINKLRRQTGLTFTPADVLEIKSLLLTALDEADIVGVSVDHQVSDEHREWARRTEAIYRARAAHRRRPALLTNCYINAELRQALPALLAGQKRVSVISPRDLRGTLDANFGIRDVSVYQVPSQYVVRDVDGMYEAAMHDVEMWPDFYRCLQKGLEVRERGEVFLVGAGVFGKELCVRIRDLGGIALDMGATLDALAGKVTRGPGRPPLRPLPAAQDKADPVIGLRHLPYLEETGWLRSHRTQESVDRGGQPIPWYRYAAIGFLLDRVQPEQQIFEFGSGNSTLWWAARAAYVTSVEHDPSWAARVREAVPENVTLAEVPLDRDGEYCRTPARAGGRYEIVVIDGRDRVNCAYQCLGSLAEEGVIVWDDSHRRRYQRGQEFLLEKGFNRLRFTGLGPITGHAGETSIFYRSTNCLNI